MLKILYPLLRNKDHRLAKLILTFFSVLLLDQATKYLVQTGMGLYTSIPVIGQVLKLTYIRNPGAAFGISVGNRFVFIALSFLACAVMVYYFLRMPREEVWGRFALTLIFGGAIGNLIDRVLYGEVTDFIEVGVAGYYWPVFNVADMAVTIGVILLFFRMSSERQTAPHDQLSQPSKHQSGTTAE